MWINLYEAISIQDPCLRIIYNLFVNLSYKIVNVISIEWLLWSRKISKCLTCICSFNHYVIPCSDYNDFTDLLMRKLRHSEVIIMHQNTQEQNVGAHFLILMLLVLNTELIYTGFYFTTAWWFYTLGPSWQDLKRTAIYLSWNSELNYLTSMLKLSYL